MFGPVSTNHIRAMRSRPDTWAGILHRHVISISDSFVAGKIAFIKPTGVQKIVKCAFQVGMRLGPKGTGGS